MKMKMLDYSLIVLLSSLATGAAAQQARQPDPPADPATAAPASGALPEAECSDDGCRANGEVLMRVRTRGERQPATGYASEASSSAALQPDRRVTVQTEQAGKVVAVGKWSVALPNGGAIWATEDPDIGAPRLSVSAPSLVPFENGRITTPVRFYAYSNYSAFVDRAEILIFQSSDSDLVHPLATIPLTAASVSEVSWDGVLPPGLQARTGDSLSYIVRAHGADGAIDETSPRSFQLALPVEVERGLQRMRESTERQYGSALSGDQALRQSLIDSAFGGDSLRQQNIPIYGSQIRIQGRNLPAGYSVAINGQSHPVDLENKLVAEYLVPVGQHSFDIQLSNQAKQTIRHQLQVDVTGRYLFALALADLTASKNSVSGSIEPLAGDERYEKDMLVEGRLAFYLKGKVKGKYLITAQADTQEREVRELFNGFWDADPQDVFRRLDPDEYYPVYGDDSATYRDIDTQGRLYVRVDWDKNQALWGNYHTGFTGTEYGQYSRALYGAALNWRSRRTTAYGEPSNELRAFGSEAQSLPGHTEFLGYNGSFYYLKHTDLLPGSEQVVLEVRDPTTGRVERRVPLVAGVDYEIDNFQGRIILSRALAQITRENMPTLTRDRPLDGWRQVLMVDYEYTPSGFHGDDVTAGVRGKHWFGDHFAIGGTWVDESRAGEDYSIRGADVTLQAGRGTYLKAEYTQTEARSAPIWYSDNGGLSFAELNSGLGAREGDAKAVEARVNFKELGWTQLDWSAGAWWRSVGAGFSVSRFDLGMRIEEHGVEVQGQFAPNINVYGRWSVAERGAETLEQAQLTGEWRVNDDVTFAAELRRVQEDRLLAQDAVGTLAALQYRQRFGTALEAYGTAQFTVDDDDGRYDDNDAFTLGAKYLFGNLSTVGAEVTSGDRGDSALVNAEYRLSPEHSVYGSYTFLQESTDYDPLFNKQATPGWVIGQRWRLSDQVNMYNESQFLKAPRESGIAHTFGMDFYPAVGWNLGFQLQDGELDALSGVVDRRAVSVNGGLTSNATQWQSKFEWRRDTGAERREQWATTHRLTHKINESWRIAARFNYSDTDDELNPLAGAKFIEGNVGFALRPWNSTRWALFGKYTYLYDVSSLPQVGDDVAFYDQRSRILSLEGVYNPDSRWEFAGKLMRRTGEVRMGRLQGDWADSTASFAAAQVRYTLAEQWHGLAEYRWLGVDDGGDLSGFLIGIDRDIGRNFRVGLGYNFTDFSDDLTDFDYDHKGFFLNVVGRY